MNEKMKNVKNIWGSSQEKSSCGVGFLASLKGEITHKNLRDGLRALSCEEHRGGCSHDMISSDGSGIMTDIPFEFFGFSKGEMAVATLLIPLDSENQRLALNTLHETFSFFDLEIESFRDVPVDTSVVGPDALKNMPAIKQVFIKRPRHSRTDASFNRLLHIAKQYTRLKAAEKGLKEFFFSSISMTTIVYKALTRANMLDKFYLDLQKKNYKTRFTIFHRRFSTNTHTSWDKAQPFRVIAHNGEINTISGNRSWAYSREKSLGFKDGELLSHSGISDTGTLNEITEALLYRSSIPYLEEIMSILIPPAAGEQNYYRFWSRAMEAWDGPAFVTFSNGSIVGARLDRNGFRPCRWAKTDTHFYLSSEAGSFEIDERSINAKGTLHAGTGVAISLKKGEIYFKNPSESFRNINVKYDPHLLALEEKPIDETRLFTQERLHKSGQIFGCTKEEIEKVLIPMIESGKEPIGSMGDTARLAVFSEEPRSFFDYFYQNFAQVTNPPVDYLREGSVTDLRMNLGRKANIFSPKELTPMPPAFQLDSPVVSLSQMEFLFSLSKEFRKDKYASLKIRFISILFKKNDGEVGFRSSMKRIEREAVSAITDGVTIIVLTDKDATEEDLPIPSLIALRVCAVGLSSAGYRLAASILVHTADVRTTHHFSTLVGFGATAVCPYFALSLAREYEAKQLDELDPDDKEKKLIEAYKQGLLKVMSKMGISVARSYESSKLYSAVGLGKELCLKLFRGVQSPISGLEIPHLVKQIILQVEKTTSQEFDQKLINTYLYKELPRGGVGEKHSMTTARSKIIHKLARETDTDLTNVELYKQYLDLGEESEPVNVRHLFSLKSSESNVDVSEVEDEASILKTFGSGGMSFGAISAESQRDIFLAMEEIGGRSNSGEGGENPFYFKEGIKATSKQVASGRFGVTAEYLSGANEIQIKIAQGAKPGEGGQLMSPKVNEDIARARHSKIGIDLISPPPMHDIYSIEDLKELIYELRQVNPSAEVCVKLVSGVNVGTIAVGVVKAGADVIHISGFDGGTGAASLSSMRHAGLPWEIGLWETHRELVKNNLRRFVKLRVDGGISTGKDIVLASILGAEEYDFGKLLLVAEGCIMARICQLNTCPTGIATHNPKFKAKYKGTKDNVVKIIRYIAQDVRNYLALMGKKSLREIVGRTDLLEVNPRLADLITKRNIDLSFFMSEFFPEASQEKSPFSEGVSSLNKRILQEAHSAVLEEKKDFFLTSEIFVYDRAALATLSGEIAKYLQQKRYKTGDFENEPSYHGNITTHFKGSAGQGFGVFLVKGIKAYLSGDANDSVCKGMSGGKAIIRPPEESKLETNMNVIIGNCALYGATGGTLYVEGVAGDRFAVRNSGATAVVEGVGLHACEYMTDGFVVILGELWHNLGAGMTGGKVVVYKDENKKAFINTDYITEVKISDDVEQKLKLLLEDYEAETENERVKNILERWNEEKNNFTLFLPVKEAKLFEKEEKVKTS